MIGRLNRLIIIYSDLPGNTVMVKETGLDLVPSS